MTYKLTLGLEIHLQPKTELKMFCGCDANIWAAEPNTHTCPTCLGLPGALPVPNFEAVKKTQLLGLALNCSLNENSRFDRKHYFYPDLPKGYQISQYKQPLCIDGFLYLDSGKKAEIERIHLEEDVAKSFHEHEKTLVDFNKSGLPLIEIVTRPTFNSTEDAVEFCKKIQTVVRFLGIGDVDMEKGQMRLEANISLRTEEMEKKHELAPYKVEVKNINSFRFMEKAVKAEIVRQKEILESGGKVLQENRGFNEATGKTVSQRSKEEAHDYRYFPEPDIPPMNFEKKYLEDLKKELPELPYQMEERLVKKYKISENSAKLLVYSFGTDAVGKFESMVKDGIDAQKAANALINKKELIAEVPAAEKTSGADLETVVQKTLDQNPKAIEDYKNGKSNSVEFLLGMVMRETKGKADPAEVRKLILKKLGE
jgi:aspartyl-tRNA(Asn)/glutamyl-tRNA(Gln) amidotransferase subunit B